MPSVNCPECEEEVYVDAESEQGDEVSCDECGTRLVVVGLDPIELDPKGENESDDAEKDFDSLDYGSEDHY